MKSTNARYLGMTHSQLGILGGAAMLALLIIGGLSWFFFTTLSAPSATVATTVIPLTTSPYVRVTVTVAPTPTPTLEIATTRVPPNGWVESRSPGVTLWLPANFIGGDMTVNRTETIKKVSGVGSPHFKNTVSAMKQAPSSIVLWLVDKTISNKPIIMTILVTRAVNSEGIGIDQYIQNNTTDTSTGRTTTVFETKKITLLGREARRVTYQQQMQAAYGIAGVAYYIQDGNDFWIVDYNADPNDYTDMLPMAEQSAHTFNLVHE